MFKNYPPIDFTIEKNRDAFRDALSTIEREIKAGTLYAAPIIGGEEKLTGRVIQSLDPSEPAVSVGKVFTADEKDAERAMEIVTCGFAAWRDLGHQKRAGIIRRAGDIMAERKLALSALIVREAGKPWREAEADVGEAIDFCHYYADEMLRLSAPQKMGDLPGEDNRYFYEPRGVALIIAPWNFPLAIACGMLTAALVTGNSAILKPSEQTSIIAYKLARILYEAGVPKDAFVFLPGPGSVIGRKLTAHAKIDVICFTGSLGVGLEIMKQAALVQPGQKKVKKVIAEMGGKNAVIVDEDADLDEAIKGVIYSSFGYAGQKCSACSRVIVVGTAYEPFLERLKEACADIISGPAQDSSTLLGPVIDQTSRDRILKIIAETEKRAKVLYKGPAKEPGYFVPATVFRDLSPSDPLWKEEVFGPVLAACQARDFTHALELALDSPYALTGGVFSRSPKNIARARDEFRVGNLYINRGCTGALVYRQPFGGSCMSGVGSKAGGPDYLQQFLEPRSITENTMRRGFSPDL